MAFKGPLQPRPFYDSVIYGRGVPQAPGCVPWAYPSAKFTSTFWGAKVRGGNLKYNSEDP